MSRLPAAVSLLISILLWASTGSAELIVIDDSGATKPLAPFVKVFEETPGNATDRPVGIPTDNLGAAELSNLLPIRTPELTPGPVTRRPLSLPNNGVLPRPFFLIGADDRSKEWLSRHRNRLQAIGAVGMLVQADTEADLAAIARFADGLPILPAPATDIARVLNLKHIPALVSRHGIEQ